jgi:uncharacterized OB-fold protein
MIDTDTPSALPMPTRDAQNSPYWDALERGQHVFQRCLNCGNAWLPARRECPKCLTDRSVWEVAGGHAKLVSWVVFHTAFHPAFRSRLPYIVAIVQLIEGPRLISNLVGVDDPASLRIDRELRLQIEREGDFSIPRYRVANFDAE